MAIVQFRQGIISHGVGANDSQAFLQYSTSSVNLLATSKPVKVTFIDGDTNYLFVEKEDVNSAWSGLPTNDCWLYWEISTLDGKIKRDFTTLEPVESENQPVNPAVGQMWFKPTYKYWQVWNGSAFVKTLRVFACKLVGGTAIYSTSINAPKFTGTQVGIVEEAKAGAITYDESGLPLKKANGQFFTTEDRFVAGVPSSADIRLSSVINSGRATTALPAYSVIQYNDFREIGFADPLKQGIRLYGIVEVDAVEGDTVNFVTEGTIQNIDWQWSKQGAKINDPVFIGNLGELTLVPIDPEQQPVGVVSDDDKIYFSPSLFPQVFVNGDSLSGATPEQLAILQSTTAMATANTTNINSLASSIDGKLNTSGGTMTGDLTLSGEPSQQLHAVTKGYVDSVAANNADTSEVTMLLDEKLDIGGGVMGGQITLPGDPTEDLHTATKRYVDSAVSMIPIMDTSMLEADLSGKLDINGGTMTGNLVLAWNPTDPMHAATKSYVDETVSAIGAGPSSAESVDLTSNQTILGEKTFAEQLILGASGDNPHPKLAFASPVSSEFASIEYTRDIDGLKIATSDSKRDMIIQMGGAAGIKLEVNEAGLDGVVDGMELELTPSRFRMYDRDFNSIMSFSNSGGVKSPPLTFGVPTHSDVDIGEFDEATRLVTKGYVDSKIGGMSSSGSSTGTNGIQQRMLPISVIGELLPGETFANYTIAERCWLSDVEPHIATVNPNELPPSGYVDVSIMVNGEPAGIIQWEPMIPQAMVQIFAYIPLYPADVISFVAGPETTGLVSPAITLILNLVDNSV